ncbi:MAG: hypothetical protein OXD54_06865 [Candidatus Poribacteria bacterium]|nr:hypothetical protein [Candidatus Poribacteria bacterium]
MKYILPYLLSVSILSIIGSLCFGQQQIGTLEQIVETQAQQISKLQDKLQVLEDVGKMELAAKLAEANARLADAEFGKFERTLRDSNNQWLLRWIIIFSVLGLGILTAIGVAIRISIKSLMESAVEKRIEEFMNAEKQVKIQQERIRLLEKEHAVTVIDDMLFYRLGTTYPYPGKIEAISDTALLDIFNDEKQLINCRCKAAEILADRESEQIVSPLVAFLNSIFDYDPYTHRESKSLVPIKFSLQKLIKSLGMIHTEETYKELTKFLDRLLKEYTPMKDMLLTWTVFSLANVGKRMNTGSSIPKMIKAVPNLRSINGEMSAAIKNLALYFNKFDEPDGIKDILTHFGDKVPKVKETCLDLLESYYPNFVAQQRASETTAHTENGDTS